MRTLVNRRTVAALSAVALTLAVTACGSDGQGAAPQGGGTDHVTVGLVPIVDVAPVYLGIEKGFYRENGIDLEAKTATGGAALLPAVVSGDYQFGFSEVASLVVASSKGLPIRMVTPASFSTGDAKDDYAGLLVGKGSAIKDVTGLAGKTVAINSIQGINYLLARDAIDRAGGDSSKVKFVEMAFPDMLTALDHQQVDAIFEPQPFYTIGQSQGDVVLNALYANATPNFEVTSYFTTKQFAAKNADLVARFKKATEQSLAYAQEHPDEARKVVTTYTTIDPKVVADMTLPKWPVEFNQQSLGFVAKAAETYGLTDSAVDITSMMGSDG